MREKKGGFKFELHHKRIESQLNLNEPREWKKPFYNDVKTMYEGEIKVGTLTPYGRGNIFYVGVGILYEGWFKDGVKSGYGREFIPFEDGYINEGEYSNNRLNGQLQLSRIIMVIDMWDPTKIKGDTVRALYIPVM